LSDVDGAGALATWCHHKRGKNSTSPGCNTTEVRRAQAKRGQRCRSVMLLLAKPSIDTSRIDEYGGSKLLALPGCAGYIKGVSPGGIKVNVLEPAIMVTRLSDRSKWQAETSPPSGEPDIHRLADSTGNPDARIHSGGATSTGCCTKYSSCSLSWLPLSLPRLRRRSSSCAGSSMYEVDPAPSAKNCANVCPRGRASTFSMRCTMTDRHTHRDASPAHKHIATLTASAKTIFPQR
jgi:hypothetical protein